MFLLPGRASLLHMEPGFMWLWLSSSLKLPNICIQLSRGAFAMGNFGARLTVQVLCAQLGGSVGFAHAAAGEERRYKSTISSQIFLTSVFTQQHCSCPRGTSPSLPCKAFPCGPCQQLPVQPYLLSTPQAHVTEPSSGNRTRSSPARPVPTRVTFAVSPGRAALWRGWVKDSDSQCAISGVVTGRPPCYI